jgi:putative endonuclease
MPIFSQIIFQVVRLAARKGLREEESFASEAKKHEARRTGVRGKTFACWYLRGHGYVFVVHDYMPRGAKGELDLLGYDGPTLAFVEVRKRTTADGQAGLTEMSVTRDKQHVLIRTAKRFPAERHAGDCPCRCDVLAIDNRPGHPPAVRLHKDAFSPQQ